MKQLSIMLAVLMLYILTAGNISAQDQPNNILVVSYQKVKFGAIDDANKLFNEKMGPVLNSIVDDGMLRSWGLFNHAWGDEWNVNVWYVVDNMEAFTKFWQEYVKRLNEKSPGAFEGMREYIMEHKDNIYTIMNQYPMPPAK